MELYNGDCLEIMKGIPDGSIDMVLCDLPYGTTKCKWDSIIPFDLMWEQYERIIKNNGAIVLFGTEPFSSMLRMSNMDLYKYDWVWDKHNGNGFLDCKVRPIKTHENIMVFSKGGCSNGSRNKMTYNPQGLVPCLQQENRKTTGELLNGVKTNSYVRKFTNYPKSILSFSKENKKYHPTQKPVLLLEYLIKTYTNEGETVLDNCMGSGGTGVACMNTGRNFIGIEIDNRYFDIASERVLGAQASIK